MCKAQDVSYCSCKTPPRRMHNGTYGTLPSNRPLLLPIQGLANVTNTHEQNHSGKGCVTCSRLAMYRVGVHLGVSLTLTLVPSLSCPTAIPILKTSNQADSGTYPNQSQHKPGPCPTKRRSTTSERLLPLPFFDTPPHLSSQTSCPPCSDLEQTALPHGLPSSSGHDSPGRKKPWCVWQPEETSPSGPESRQE